MNERLKAGELLNQPDFLTMTEEHAMEQNCPLCGKTEHLICDNLGEDGAFYSCQESRGGCGSTFRITPDGKCVDIF